MAPRTIFRSRTGSLYQIRQLSCELTAELCLDSEIGQRCDRCVEHLHISEGGLWARLLYWPDADEVALCQRLRHAYFVRERGWVPEDPARPGLESDSYDPFCHHLAVFDAALGSGGEGRLAAYIRALPWREGTGFMLERDFSRLLPQGYGIVTEGSVELSRLVVAPHIKERGPAAARQAAELLLKLLYRLSLWEGWSAYYAVVEEAWIKTFTRRFRLPFAPIGEPHAFPDGTWTVAAIAYRQAMEENMKRHDPAKYAWYTEQTEE